MIELKDVRKNFRDREAVAGVSLTVEKGVITGLLGPNGAGKTTTIRMIMDIIRPDSGSIRIDGISAGAPHPSPGYLPEERGLYQKTAVEETLKYFAALRGFREAEGSELISAWLGRFQLTGREKDRIGSLSKGNQQKVQLIIALLTRAEHLILDEPFTGLDPANQVLVREILHEYRDSGKSILLSTHQMEVAEKLCDRFILMNSGRIVGGGTLEELQAPFKNDTVEFRVDLPQDRVTADYLEHQVYSRGILTGVLFKDVKLSETVERLSRDGRLQSFRQSAPGLEEIFLRMTEDNGE